MPVSDKSLFSFSVTTCRKHCECIGYHLVQLLICMISTVDLMEHLTVLNKQYTSRMTGCLDGMCHHQNRLPCPVDLRKQPKQFIRRPGVERPRRYCVVSKNDSFVQFCFSLAPIGARSGLYKRQIAQKRGPNRELLPARSSFTFSSYFFR